MKKSDVLSLVQDQLLPAYENERERLDQIDLWYRWKQENPIPPRGATRELKALLELSKTPWLNLVVTTIAQAMFVDGFRSESGADLPWRTWNANNFDMRQTAVHRGALAYGQSFVTVTPGDDTAMMRGVSARKMYAVYQDPAEDDWPMFALRVDRSGKSRMFRLYDETHVWYLGEDQSGKLELIEWREHGAGVCPVVRYSNMLDLDGRTDGEVEPFIGVASRINKTQFDRLMVQHFNSWKVRTVAGMQEPDTQEDANVAKFKLRHNDLLVAEDPDTKFGTLDETPLDGFVRSYESDIEALAATSQTPSHNLTGKMVNLSAEALAAARAPLSQKVFERQVSFGKSHVQALQLAASLEGNTEAAMDVSGRVTWQDMEIRSLSQAVDALGKAATMLGIPKQALWGRIPGVMQSDVTEWENLAMANDPLSQYLNKQVDGDDGVF